MGGLDRTGKALPVMLSLLILWSLAGAPSSGSSQNVLDTDTPPAVATDTDLPSVTPSETAELATPTLELASTASASPTIEAPPTLTPVHVTGKYVPDEVLVRFRQRAAAAAING